MRMYDIIARKRDGNPLSQEEIAFAVEGFTRGTLPDYQMAALLMAIFLRGMDGEETALLTACMAQSGEMVDLSGIQGVKADKHSTGGVGDKTTLVAAPLAAACGVKVAKMSGRALGHTGGTIDKLEAIPHFKTSLTKEAFYRQVNEIGIAVIGQSGNLAPADKKLYALRDVTATVNSLPLIASSVMSKKLASGADAILLDVKTGSGAFMKTLDDSVALARVMVEIARRNGRRAAALITDMDLPLGRWIGNSLEIAEVSHTLQNNGPKDLTQVSVEIAAGMLLLAGKGTLESCRTQAWQALENGSGFEKLRQMVLWQGGDVSVIDDPSLFPKAPVLREVIAAESGFIAHMDTEKVGIASVLLGAGRTTKEEGIDYAAGIRLLAKTGDAVQKGQPVAILETAAEEKAAAAASLFADALSYSADKPPYRALIQAFVDERGEVRQR